MTPILRHNSTYVLFGVQTNERMNLPKMRTSGIKRRQRAVENQNSHSLEKTHFCKIRDHVRCMCEDSCACV